MVAQHGDVGMAAAHNRLAHLIALPIIMFGIPGSFCGRELPVTSSRWSTGVAPEGVSAGGPHGDGDGGSPDAPLKVMGSRSVGGEVGAD